MATPVRRDTAAGAARTTFRAGLGPVALLQLLPIAALALSPPVGERVVDTLGMLIFGAVTLALTLAIPLAITAALVMLAREYHREHRSRIASRQSGR